MPLATTSARTAAGSNRTKAESALTRSSCDAESNFVVSLGSMNLRGKAARCAALRCAALRCTALHCAIHRQWVGKGQCSLNGKIHCGALPKYWYDRSTSAGTTVAIALVAHRRSFCSTESSCRRAVERSAAVDS